MVKDVVQEQMGGWLCVFFIVCDLLRCWLRKVGLPRREGMSRRTRKGMERHLFMAGHVFKCWEMEVAGKAEKVRVWSWLCCESGSACEIEGVSVI